MKEFQILVRTNLDSVIMNNYEETETHFYITKVKMQLH